jgi:plastocyanin
VKQSSTNFKWIIRPKNLERENLERVLSKTRLLWMLLGLSILAFATLPAARASVDNFHLFGSASQGWGFTAGTMSSPGPAITVTKGDLVNLTLTSQDGFTHRFFVDYNGNGIIDPGEPASPSFSGTINYQFTATTAGTFTYYCSFHPGVMRGTFTVTQSVGGIQVPVNKLVLIAPWLGIACLAAICTVSLVYITRRKKQ